MGRQRRHLLTMTNANRTIKGATVNRELDGHQCVFDLAVKRKYNPENSAAAGKHFNELRERPIRRMLTVEEELRILEAAPISHLRVAIILLSQTGGRTYSEGFSLRWDQMNFEDKLIRLDNNVKTPGSAEPIPLSEYACEVLAGMEQGAGSQESFCLSGLRICQTSADFHGQDVWEGHA